MITLITGIPGMGKTALLVSMLLEYEKAAERPLFVMGINNLGIEHIKAPPVSEWTEKRPDPDDPTLMLDYYLFPPNSILIIDECQRVFRPRSSGSKVPPEIAAMETHRHTGLDIILLTQKPKLVDMNIRELVGKHIHIRNGLLGRYLYEWPHIADGESRLDRSEASKRKFKPPKEAFSKYKSAEVHTKHSFRLNQMFVYLAVATSACLFLSFRAYSSISQKINPPDKQTQNQSIQNKAGQGAPRSSAGGPAQAHKVISTTTTTDQLIIDPVNAHNHPYEGFKFVMKGLVERKGKKSAFIDLISPSGEIIHLTDNDLFQSGYTTQIMSACLVLIRIGQVGLTATCGDSTPPRAYQPPAQLLAAGVIPPAPVHGVPVQQGVAAYPEAGNNQQEPQSPFVREEIIEADPAPSGSSSHQLVPASPYPSH